MWLLDAINFAAEANKMLTQYCINCGFTFPEDDEIVELSSSSNLYVEMQNMIRTIYDGNYHSAEDFVSVDKPLPSPLGATVSTQQNILGWRCH
ncbi:unnamed protein product [Diamesa hyperborea]